jgi:uncharacterized surface protein with fasciclin (FAS1) repeats
MIQLKTKVVFVSYILATKLQIKINMKKQFLSLTLGVAFMAAITACNSTKTESATGDSAMVDTAMTDSKPAETGVEVGGAMMVPSKNIVENALGSKDHTTLVAAVKQAGLAETLSGAGPFTVFAPTNEAFAQVPKATLDALMKPEMKADLTKILTYHVVSGALKAADLKDGQELTTVQGGKLKVSVKDGMVMINGAQVTIADVISSNGVTHVINGVLMPK